MPPTTPTGQPTTTTSPPASNTNNGAFDPNAVQTGAGADQGAYGLGSYASMTVSLDPHGMFADLIPLLGGKTQVTLLALCQVFNRLDRATQIRIEQQMAAGGFYTDSLTGKKMTTAPTNMGSPSALADTFVALKNVAASAVGQGGQNAPTTLDDAINNEIAGGGGNASSKFIAGIQGHGYRGTTDLSAPEDIAMQVDQLFSRLVGGKAPDALKAQVIQEIHQAEYTRGQTIWTQQNQMAQENFSDRLQENNDAQKAQLQNLGGVDLGLNGQSNQAGGQSQGFTGAGIFTNQPGQAPTVMGNINTPTDFAMALLTNLGVTPNPANVAFLVAWQRKEGGNWHNFAAFNPLNTSMPMSGSTTGNGDGVQAYKSWNDGIQATAQTLKQSSDQALIQALNGTDAQAMAKALAGSTWGGLSWSNSSASQSYVNDVLGMMYQPYNPAGKADNYPAPTDSGISPQATAGASATDPNSAAYNPYNPVTGQSTISGSPVGGGQVISYPGGQVTTSDKGVAGFLQAAFSQVGTPYGWGGESPGVAFDCSGLVQWALGQVGVKVPRTATDQYNSAAGAPVQDIGHAAPGDLIFFYSPYNAKTGEGGANPTSFEHVGIYLGTGANGQPMMLNADHSGSTVHVESIDGFGAYRIKRFPVGQGSSALNFVYGPSNFVTGSNSVVTSAPNASAQTYADITAPGSQYQLPYQARNMTDAVGMLLNAVNSHGQTPPAQGSPIGVP